MLISQGYPAIATFGAQVTDEQIKLLRVFQAGLMLAPDHDPPGELWRRRLIHGLIKFIPLLDIPLVDGSGSDLGDLEPDDISLHLRGVKVVTSYT
jgi:hypothetical protein